MTELNPGTPVRSDTARATDEYNEFRWISQPRRVREDSRCVVGRGRYVAEITPPGTLHVGLVTSPHPHARITGIDTSEALELEGLVTVLTGAELAKDTEPLL